MIVAAGTTSKSIDVQIVDDSGLAVTGLVAATFPATSYSLGVNAATTSISLSDLADITSLYSSGGVKERSGGFYRLDLPNAVLATDGTVARIIGEASGKHLIAPEIIVGNVPGNVKQISGQTASATSAVNFDYLNGIQRQLSGLSRTLAGASEDGVPDWFNLEKAAHRIRYGWCNSLWVGDSQLSPSTTPRALYGIIRTWDVKWAGIHVPASAEVSDEGYNAYFNGATGFTATTAILPSGSANGVTNDTALLMSSAVASGAISSNVVFYDCYLGVLDLYNGSGVAPKLFSNGDWTVRQRLKAAILYAKHPTSGTNLSTAGLSSQRGTDTVGGAVYDLTAASSGHSRIAFDFSTPTATAQTYTRSYWSTGSENETSKVFAHTGHIIYDENATSGYSHAAIAVGGWSTTDHLSSLNSGGDATYYSSDGKYTQAQLVTTLGLLRNPNTFFISIGTNLGADEDGSTVSLYKANLLKIINRYRAACTTAGITDPLFVLISPWMSGGSDTADLRAYRDAQANAMYELAQTYPADVGFLNLHGIIKRRLGAYTLWNSTYLGDSTHTNTTGSTTFWGYAWDAICEAASVYSLALVAMKQGRKLDLDASATAATAVTGSVLDLVANKNSNKGYSQATDSLEAQADAASSGGASVEAIAAAVWAYVRRSLTGGPEIITGSITFTTKELVKGNDYSSGNQPWIVSLANSSITDLSTYTWTFAASRADDNLATGDDDFTGTVTVTQATGDTRAVRIDITAATTDSLAKGYYEGALRGTSSSKSATQVFVLIKVLDDPNQA